MYFLDVKETYFQGYRDALDPVYKDPRGKICKYSEMNKKFVYGTPFYNGDEDRKLNIETKKYLFRSNSDWTHVKRIVTDLNRLPVAVSIFKKSNNCIIKSINNV